MSEAKKTSSRFLYRIVAVRPDRSRTVLMTGLEIEQASAARAAMAKDDPEFVWFIVERETA
jgi:hypothetical protein